MLLAWLFGLEGTPLATTTSVLAPVSIVANSQYNDHDVIAYDVLIRKADGQVVTAKFEDDDFNVYPPHNATSYPAEGDVFTVRYLAHFPQDFVIVSNDASPWALKLRCSGLLSAVYDAEQKKNFAPDVQDYHHAYDDAVRAAHDAGCGFAG